MISSTTAIAHQQLTQAPEQFQQWLAEQPNWWTLVTQMTQCPPEPAAATPDRGIHRAGLWLLAQGEYELGWQWLRALNPSHQKTLWSDIIPLAQQLETEGSLAEAARLLEHILEWDPDNEINLLMLMGLAARIQDDWRVALYSQALRELWAVPDRSCSISLEQCLHKSIDFLLKLGYTDTFFKLVGAFARHCLTPDIKKPIFGLLHLFALEYAPRRTSDFQGLWDPLDLAHGRLRDLLNTLFVKDDSIKSYSIIANNIETIALSLSSEHSTTQLSLLSEAVHYHLKASQHQKAQQCLEWILKKWSVADLQQELPNVYANASIRMIFEKMVGLCFDMAYITDDRSLIRSYQRVVEKGFSLSHIHAFPEFCRQPTGSNALPSTFSSCPRRIRVGYLGSGFYSHPVGLLSWQTMLSHNPENFEIFCFAVDMFSNRTAAPDDPVRSGLQSQLEGFRHFQAPSWQDVLNQIRSDDLDILVYTDASTSPYGFNILPFRAARIQMTWLGGDSPAIPELDYFLVDPYVLPQDAQSDYDETLLRLPTFVAVDSFDVGRLDPMEIRRQFKISTDTIVYWTAANAAKRSPDSVEAHLRIVANVPDSILVVKGIGDFMAVRQRYIQAAKLHGLVDKLRFVKVSPKQTDHRAQLAAADLVLDTFPYTGATHTLESLYVGTPVLTLVGRHYYGRMSYSLLKNCQLEDCITHTLDDYIQRGIQLGSDREYLARVKAQVRACRSTSPIWDAQGFARSLEDTYRQVIAEKLKEGSLSQDQ